MNPTHCPACTKSLPNVADINFCPHCGILLQDYDAEGNLIPPPDPVLSDPEPEVEPAEPVQETHSASEVPWESEEPISFAQRLTTTWSEAVLQSQQFFTKIKPGIDIRRALFYGVLFKYVGYVFAIFWARRQYDEMPNTEEMPELLQRFFSVYMESFMQQGILEQMFIGIFVAIFSMLIMPLIFHAGLAVFGLGRNGYAVSFRVLAYAESTAIFYAIPFVGEFVHYFWWAFLVITGWREAHGISTGQAVLALFVPIATCCVLMFMLISVFSAVLLNLGTG